MSTTPLARLHDSLVSLRSQAPTFTPDILVVAGSGLGAIAQTVQNPHIISYDDIAGFYQSGVTGHAGELVLGTIGNASVAVLSGRVHLYEGHDASAVVHAVRTLALWGARSAILTNAAGLINAAFEPGCPMVITDHINLSGQHPLTGAHEPTFGPRFPDMTAVYDAGWQVALKQALEMDGKCFTGIYAAVPGPSYETPAEVRMLRTLGADAVGMSTVLEAIALHSMGVRVAGVSIFANWAAGMTDDALSHEEVMAAMTAAGERVAKGIVRSIEKI